MAPRIGFIGLGMMGRGMARNLLDRGFALTAMAHRRREALENLVAKGDVSGLQFSLANAEKDIRYYTHMTGIVPLAGSLGKTVHDTLLQGLALGFTECLVGSLMEAQAKLNGVEIIGQRVPLRA